MYMHLFIFVVMQLFVKPFAYLQKPYHQNSNAGRVSSACNPRISGLKFLLIPRTSGDAP